MIFNLNVTLHRFYKELEKRRLILQLIRNGTNIADKRHCNYQQTSSNRVESRTETAVS